MGAPTLEDIIRIKNEIICRQEAEIAVHIARAHASNLYNLRFIDKYIEYHKDEIRGEIQ
jgi:hypothetical protein